MVYNLEVPLKCSKHACYVTDTRSNILDKTMPMPTQSHGVSLHTIDLLTHE